MKDESIIGERNHLLNEIKFAPNKKNIETMEQSTLTHKFSINSIKLMSEGAEIGQINDEAALFLSNQVTRLLKTVLQQADKFRHHSKRKKLMTKDIDHALKTMNMTPVVGFTCTEQIPFRFASGGGHKIYYPHDKEIELADVIARLQIPKEPKDVALESHWLAIDGIQPAIPQNPPPLTRDEQRLECVDPLTYMSGYSANNTRNKMIESIYNSNPQTNGSQQHLQHLSSSWNPINNQLTGLANTNVLKKHIETVQIKPLATHELSVEQQLYYKEITEVCVGSNEQKRSQALNSLAQDPGLHQVLPRLCTFISEGVKVNVVHNNLILLIYLIRMVKALLDNQSLYLEKYLHELCPTVITCIVAKQICSRPDQDNHYALRDFASKLLANICRTYNTSTNNLQTRITRLLCRALDNANLPLSSVYGCVSALCELGPEVQQALLVRRIPQIRERLNESLVAAAAAANPNASPSTTRPTPTNNSPEGRILNLLASKVVYNNVNNNNNSNNNMNNAGNLNSNNHQVAG